MTSTHNHRIVAATVLSLLLPAGAASARGDHRTVDCPPAGRAIGYSDALDKLSSHGATVGGLSDLAWDRRTRSYVSTVDNHGTDPSRVWFFSDLTHPTVTREPLILKRPDGTPYTGVDADDEGLAMLPDGRFVVGSETEPAIRIFGRDGVQQTSLSIPDRFKVAPAGQATSNATLEGLTLSPDGHTLLAAMEGALSGDSAADDATAHRFLIYRHTPQGWRLTRQLGYRTQPGNRVPEVQFYDHHSLLVEEAAFDATTGNRVQLYAVPDVHAPDVSAVDDLGQAGPSSFVDKILISDVTGCPSLGAPSRQKQPNPLMDNYEGMTVTHRRARSYDVALMSDDNFNPGQISRILNLQVRLPRAAGS